MSPNGSDRSSRRPMRRKLPQVLTAGLILATASGCSYNWEDFPRLGMPTPVTEEAPRILSLWQGSWAAALATGVLVWGLILWSVIFHRRSRTKVEVPPQTRYNMPIEALYTVTPLIIVSVLFYFTARDESKLLALSDKPAHTINVVGYQWSWGFNYIENVDGDAATGAEVPKELGAVPDKWQKQFPAGAEGVHDFGIPGTRNPQTGNPGPTLWLPKGEKVRFVLTSRDVIHSFWVVPFLMKQDVIPGHTNAFEVTPTQEGTFLGKCAELCGVDHSRMLFNVKVVSPERYQQHLKELAEKGQTGYIPSGIEQTDPARNAEKNQL
ncbi:MULTISPECIES: aa3-type cytochrome oxidase subunit II [Streptomyces]|uniref:Probable cytochrome c oxidase subunit 2 n=2 Tax=Streptomyces TaxID=1883 RepID=A0A1D8FZ99_9ACTN|nr:MULTISPECIES: cytochrome c oxidase subunit II [Streptomyces]AOT58529.1 Cytochrome c oxidase subunit 2 precursor [Streptomyces rubrolavendulae]KAF0648518.1 cytochrome c oxidase subunit II [Streptomyces fradiae ATCC 10745 = DSM 40063]OSY49425.1 Cytochrome c oxidase subunit 2 precursor [Streptomyces fradiae ATCC 10745 = DSM 40063]QEV11868.1 cytochrome c oxidase subunit II [Streptomyces fradiae ATCC 10745 = DSM 40063]UQS28502.1 cytochrome c oxidase subunit II [Streptomyces fradiae]